MNRKWLAIFVTTLSLFCGSCCCVSQNGATVRLAYDVRAFGAVGDGKSKDTAAFQKALDTCAVNGGGDVQVPAGTYLIGSIQIGYATTIRLADGATLTGSPDITDYPMMDVRWEGRWEQGHRALIYAGNVNHIGIVGPGHIIGSQALAHRTAGARNPILIEPISCKDVRLEGFSTQNWSLWSTHPTYCSDVVIDHLNVKNGSDGLDIDSCDNVRIDSCDIDSGDDSISLKSGRGMDGARIGKPCENILITRCTLADSNFACIGIGSETSGGVRNVRIEHCKFVHSRTDAIYIKTRIGRAGVIENITGDDLDVLKGNGGFLQINLISSGNSSTVDDTVTGDAGYPVGRNFSFSNVRVDCGTLADVTKISPLKPLQGLTLSNITGKCQRGISLVNVSGARLSGIHVTGFTGPLLATDNATGTGLEGAVKYFAPPPAAGRGGGARGRGIPPGGAAITRPG